LLVGAPKAQHVDEVRGAAEAEVVKDARDEQFLGLPFYDENHARMRRHPQVNQLTVEISAAPV
jgi:hypothetical protein